jgi:hypothetical protein
MNKIILNNKNLCIHLQQLDKRNIFIIETKNKKQFTNLFLRILEYHNWNNYGNKKVLLNKKVFLEWYTLINSGDSYDDLFYGIYIPPKLINIFYKLYINFLDSTEQRFLNLINKYNVNVLKPNVHFIVINTDLCMQDNVNSDSVLRHELSHLFVNIYSEYETLAIQTFNKLSRIQKNDVKTFYGNKKLTVDIDDTIDEWAAEINSKRSHQQDKTLNKKITNLKKLYNVLYTKHKINLS